MQYTKPFRPFYNDVQIDSKMWFGKYKGLKIFEIIDKDYKYLIWCMENIEGFNLNNEAFEYLLTKEK